ncbi:MAG: hypothetical protein R6V49_00990 [Bacteroidales bacterium]
MKKILTAILVLTLMSGAIAQTTQTSNNKGSLSHSISVHLVNVNQNSNYYPWIYPCFDCFWYPGFAQQNSFLPGVSYSVSYKGMFARIGFNGMATSEHSKDDYYSTHLSRHAIMPYIGAGGKVAMKRHSFLYGVDILLRMDEYNSEYEYKNPENNYLQKTQELDYGVSPFIGFGFKINERLSLHAESALRVTGFKQTSSTEYPNSINDPVKSKKTGSRIRANALSQVGLDIKL